MQAWTMPNSTVSGSRSGSIWVRNVQNNTRTQCCCKVRDTAYCRMTP